MTENGTQGHMTPEMAAALRKQFPADLVGKLPRVTCSDCSDRRKQCDKHNKVKCAVCDSYISERHIHIDFVGHADVTSRLLEVDPEWNWEPKAEDERGVPVFDLDDHGSPVGLWIRLTVGGVTRLGYGSVPGGQPDAVKVLIGDALRNAAMRFGVALDLWAKGDRADPTAENATGSAGQAKRGGRQSAGDVFGNAAPAPPRQQKNSNPDEIDPHAQVFADEAHNASTPGDLEDIHSRAREDGKLTALVRNPAAKNGGKPGKLALYLDWKRAQVRKAAAAEPIEGVIVPDLPEAWRDKVADIQQGPDADAVVEEASRMLGGGDLDSDLYAQISVAVEARVAELGIAGKAAA